MLGKYDRPGELPVLILDCLRAALGGIVSVLRGTDPKCSLITHTNHGSLFEAARRFVMRDRRTPMRLRGVRVCLVRQIVRAVRCLLGLLRRGRRGPDRPTCVAGATA